MMVDRNGNIWLGIDDQGIYRFDIRTEQLSHITVSPEGSDIHAFFEDADGRIWIGGEFGVYLYEDGQIRQLKNLSQTLKAPATSILQTAPHRLFLATLGDGAYAYDILTKTCTRLSTQDGLPTNKINQAIADLTMRATSDGQSVDFIVHVIMNVVVDEPPFILNPVPEVVFDDYPQTIQVNLDGVASDPDDPDEGIVYSIVSNSNESALSASMNAKVLVLIRLNEDEAVADLAMRATSDGQHVDFVVHVVINAVVGLDEIQRVMMVYPNPTDGQLTLAVEGVSSYDYHVVDHLGQCVMSGNTQGNLTRLDLANLSKGIYFITIVADGNRMVQKVIVK